MKCSVCGFSLPEDSVFCRYCGARAVVPERAPTPPEPAYTAAPTQQYAAPAVSPQPTAYQGVYPHVMQPHMQIKSSKEKKRKILIITLISAVVLLLSLNVYQFFQNRDNERLLDYISDEWYFYDQNAGVIQLDGSMLYHKSYCNRLTLSQYQYMILNTEAAKYQGYRPCTECWN